MENQFDNFSLMVDILQEDKDPSLREEAMKVLRWRKSIDLELGSNLNNKPWDLVNTLHKIIYWATNMDEPLQQA